MAMLDLDSTKAKQEELTSSVKRIEEKLDKLLSVLDHEKKDNQFIDASEVARLYMVSIRTVYNWVYLGKVKYVKANGRLLFRKEELEHLLRSNNS